MCTSDSNCPTTHTCTSGSSTGASGQICCPRTRTCTHPIVNAHTCTETICAQAQIIGQCTQYTTRYWFNAQNGQCELFQFSGCGGNDNNFRTFSDCQTACSGYGGLCVRTKVSPLRTLYTLCLAQPQCVQGSAYKDAAGKFTICSTGTFAGACQTNYECYFDGFMRGCCPIKCEWVCAHNMGTHTQRIHARSTSTVVVHAVLCRHVTISTRPPNSARRSFTTAVTATRTTLHRRAFVRTIAAPEGARTVRVCVTVIK